MRSLLAQTYPETVLFAALSRKHDNHGNDDKDKYQRKLSVRHIVQLCQQAAIVPVDILRNLLVNLKLYRPVLRTRIMVVRHITTGQHIAFLIADIDRNSGIAFNDGQHKINISQAVRLNKQPLCLGPSGHITLFLLLERTRQIVGK